MAQNFLISSRHGTVYYFRRRVPNDLRDAISRPYLVRTLGTDQRGVAVVLARACAARTDALFQQLRDMKKSKLGDNQFDYILEVDLNELGLVSKLKIEATPEESAAVEAAIKAALQNLPRPTAAAVPPSVGKPKITAAELLEDFFREGIGSSRWKNPEKTRNHEYDPIWAMLLPHTNKHGLTLDAAVSYRAEVLASTAAYATKHRNLYRIHAVMVHGVEHHALDNRILSKLKMPAVKGHGKSGKANVYLPFTPNDLVLLFHSDAYRNNSFKKPSHYWLPLLGLYTGARIEELAGLHLSAFMESEGVQGVTLSDEQTTDGGKNDHSLRTLPLHSELIGAGLVKYVAQLIAEGHTRLFPEIGEAARDGYGKRATVDFTAYRRTVGVGQSEGSRSRKVFHSFRSTLAGEFFRHSVDGDLSRRLTGHAAIDVHQGTYLAAATIPMKKAAEAMNKVSFDLTHPPFADSRAYKANRNRFRKGRVTAAA